MITKLFILFEIMLVQRKLIICFENMIFTCGNMTFPEKVNYLIRKYDLFIRECAKATPTWDELTLFECFWGSN